MVDLLTRDSTYNRRHGREASRKEEQAVRMRAHAFDVQIKRRTIDLIRTSEID